jgi:RNA polymerase sigma-70 factor (ECF subfamily)
LNLIGKNILFNVKNGDSEAFKKVYQVYGKKIYNVARKFGLNHEDAEEIIQETFLKIWNNRTKIDLSLSFNAYIYTIAKSILLNNIRKNATINTYKNYIKTSEAVNTTEDEILFADLERNFNQFLNAMPPQRKMIFIMSKFQDMNNNDIAEKLNLSKRTVENQLYRALCSLKADMKELGISLPFILMLMFF